MIRIALCVSAVATILFLWWPAEVHESLRPLEWLCLFAFSLMVLFLKSPPDRDVHLPEAGEAPPMIQSGFRWSMIFFLSLCLSAVFGVDSYRSAETIAGLAAAAIFGAALSQLQRFVSPEPLKLLFLVMALALSVAGFYQYAVSFPAMMVQTSSWMDLGTDDVRSAIHRIAFGRIFSRFALPSSFACVCLAAIPLVHHRIRIGSRPMTFAVLLSILVAALVLTRSYAALALFCVYLAVDAWMRYPPSSRRWIAVACVTGLILVTVFLRPSSLWTMASADNPIRLRAANWSAALSEFRSAPFLGVGPGNFGLLFASHSSGMTKTRYAHGIHMTVLAETGCVGFLAFLALAGWFVSVLYRHRHARTHWVFSLGMMSLYALVDMVFEFPSLLFLFFFLLGLTFPASSPPARPVKIAVGSISSIGLVFCLVLSQAYGYYAAGMELLGQSSVFHPARAELKAASEQFRRAAVWWPQPAFLAANGQAGLALFRQTRDRFYVQMAHESFSDAVRRSPSASDFRSGLGETLLLMGDTPQAASQFREAARLDPRGPHLERYLRLVLESSVRGSGDDRTESF